MFSGASCEDRSKDLIVICVVLLVCALGWAHLTRLDLVTRGTGRVVTPIQTREIQAPYSGSIDAFVVEVGQPVERGQLIAEINPTEAAASLAEIQKRLRSLELQRARLDDEVKGNVWSGQLESNDPATQALMEAQVALSQARQSDLTAQMTTLLQTRLQRKRELAGTRAEIAGLDVKSKLIESEDAKLSPLIAAGALGQSERLRLDRDKAALETSREVLTEREAALAFSIEEINAQTSALQAAFRTETLSERASVLQEIAELAERLPALERRVSVTELKSPVSGIVDEVFFAAEGAVVSQGDVVALIVPSSTALHIEALIMPEDIANVEPGQSARVSLTAYDAAKYGTLNGEVMRVSADAAFEEELNARAFKVEISIPSYLRLSSGETMPVRTGMAAQVDIIRGERSILEYIWNPVIRVRDTALRE